MNLRVFVNHEELSQAAATFLTEAVRNNPQVKICVATGSTPTLTYQLWIQQLVEQSIPTNHLTIIKLDEWGGLHMGHPSTCETYIQKNIIQPLQLRTDQFVSFKSQPADPLAECLRIEKELERLGGIDLMTLGIGKNGHLGFNEPSDAWSTGPHIASLTDTSLSHSMLEGNNNQVQFGLTLGINEISSAKNIMVLASGPEKSHIVQTALLGPVSPKCPASILQGLSQATVFLDKQAAQGLHE